MRWMSQVCVSTGKYEDRGRRDPSDNKMSVWTCVGVHIIHISVSCGMYDYIQTHIGISRVFSIFSSKDLITSIFQLSISTDRDK